jgi:hypothetical protein
MGSLTARRCGITTVARVACYRVGGGVTPRPPLKGGIGAYEHRLPGLELTYSERQVDHRLF